jgi:hypothetical protein
MEEMTKMVSDLANYFQIGTKQAKAVVHRRIEEVCSSETTDLQR